MMRACLLLLCAFLPTLAVAANGPLTNCELIHYKQLLSEAMFTRAWEMTDSDYRDYGIPESFVPLPQGFRIAYLRGFNRYLNRRVFQLAIAKEESIVAAATFHFEGEDHDVIYLKNMEVAPSYKGQRLSSALFTAIDKFADHAITSFEATIEHTNLEGFSDGISKGMTPEDAARQTRVGRSLGTLGFTEVKLVDTQLFYERNTDLQDATQVGKWVIFRFSRPASNQKPEESR